MRQFLGFVLMCGALVAGSLPGATGAETSPLSATARALTLVEAYSLATKNNPTLEMMQARVERAMAETQRAWSQLKPRAQVRGSFTYNDPEVILDPSRFMPPGGLALEPIAIVPKDQWMFDVQASLPLFRGPAYHQIGAAKNGEESAELRLIRTRQDFLLRVANTYYQALGLDEVVTALEEQVTVNRQNLEAAQARFEVGRTPRSEVVRAELILVQDEQTLLQQRNNCAATKRRLAILVGLDGTVTVTRPIEPLSPLTTDNVMVDAALKQRVDLKALSLDLSAAEKLETAAWWSFLPLLDLNLLYQWQNVLGFANSHDNLALMVALTLPIYEGGLRYAEIHRAQAQIAEASASKGELARNIAETIEQLKAELMSAEAGLVTAEKAVGLAEITAEETSARYDAGTATQLDLLDTIQRRLEARIDLSRSRYTRDIARLALAHVLGEFDPEKK